MHRSSTLAVGLTVVLVCSGCLGSVLPQSTSTPESYTPPDATAPPTETAPRVDSVTWSAAACERPPETVVVRQLESSESTSQLRLEGHVAVATTDVRGADVSIEQAGNNEFRVSVRTERIRSSNSSTATACRAHVPYTAVVTVPRGTNEFSLVVSHDGDVVGGFGDSAESQR